MSRVRSIHKRKARKVNGSLVLSIGIFCVVLSFCMTLFFILRHPSTLRSPLAQLGIKSTSASSSDIGLVQFLCNKYNLSCNDIQESGSTISFTIDKGTIYLSTTKDIEQQIGSLQLTIRALTMEGKEFHRLDFRYDRPVISN